MAKKYLQHTAQQIDDAVEQVSELSQKVGNLHVADASVEDNKLHITKTDGTELEFEGGGGGTVEHEKVRIIVSTSAEGVSVSGLDIYVYYNDDTRNPVKVTTDERGMCALQVPADYKYRVVFPDVEGCNSIPDVVHTAVLRERSIEVEYKAADEIKEIATIHVRKYVQGVSQPWSGQKVTVTIGGNDAEYTTNANGIVEIEVPVGTEYTASVNPIKGMYVHGNLSHTYVAEHTVRNIYFDYHDMEVGLFFVDQNGAEYTYDEWVASGKDGSDAVFIKFAEASLLTGNAKGVFSILIDDVVNAVYTTKKAWCNQNVLFNNIPSNGNAVTAQYYYDGKGATTAIIDEAHERGLFVDAADYCWGKTYELNNGETLQGFLWSIGQNRVMFNNVTPLNAMIALVRPSATKNFTNLVSTSIWTSAQNNANYAFYVYAGVTNFSKFNGTGVLPCYAP